MRVRERYCVCVKGIKKIRFVSTCKLEITKACIQCMFREREREKEGQRQRERTSTYRVN